MIRSIVYLNETFFARNSAHGVCQIFLTGQAIDAVCGQSEMCILRMCCCMGRIRTLFGMILSGTGQQREDGVRPLRSFLAFCVQQWIEKRGHLFGKRVLVRLSFFDIIRSRRLRLFGRDVFRLNRRNRYRWCLFRCSSCRQRMCLRIRRRSWCRSNRHRSCCDRLWCHRKLCCG